MRCNNCGATINYKSNIFLNNILCNQCYHKIRKCPECKQLFMPKDHWDVVCDNCWTKEYSAEKI